MGLFGKAKQKTEFIQALATLSSSALDYQAFVPEGVRSKTQLDSMSTEAVDAFKGEMLRYALAYYIRAFVVLHEEKAVAYTEKMSLDSALRSFMVCLRYSLQLQLEQDGFTKDLAKGLPGVYIQDASGYFSGTSAESVSFKGTDISGVFARHLQEEYSFSSSEIALLTSYARMYDVELRSHFNTFAASVA